MTTITAWAQGQLQNTQQPGYTEVIDTIQYVDYIQRTMEDVVTATTLRGSCHTAWAIGAHWPYLMTLGCSGSPVYNPFYHIPPDAGWNPGCHAFDPYRKEFGDTLFIKDGLPIPK